MRKLLVTILFFLPFSTSHAEEVIQEYVFPVPSGKVNITNAYGLTETHKGKKAGYSLDLQLTGRNPDPKFKDIGGNQCFSLGAPILATRKGKVIKAINPLDALKSDYGVMVRVQYDDKSTTVYGHMLPNTLAVKGGDEVEVGQILGLMGATGNVSGLLCDWNAEDVTSVAETVHRGTHLHLETNDSLGLKVKQEPMVGDKAYTDLVVGSYTSATQMIDPTGHWAKYQGLVPYIYDGTYIAMASATAHRPRIQSFSPSVAIAGSRQTFTIKGENLPKQLHLSLLGCAGLQWLKQEKDIQQFSCTLAKKAEPRSGFIRFDEKGDVVYTFKVNTLAGPEPETFPEIKNVNIEAKRGGGEAKFKITGLNLPTDLRPGMKDCTEFKYNSASPTNLEFSCLLPHTIKDKNGKRTNGKHTFHTRLVSESTEFAYPVSFTADYEIQIKTMTPVSAVYEKEVTFTFTGKNLDLAKAVWVQSCKNFRFVEREESQIKVSCTPYKPSTFANKIAAPISPIVEVPAWAKSDFYDVIVKDVEGGTTLFSGSIVVSEMPFSQDTAEFKSQASGDSENQLNSPRSSDDIIDYILKAKGNYDNDFLKKMGWRKYVDPKGQVIYVPEECSPEVKGKNAHANMKKDCLK